MRETFRAWAEPLETFVLEVIFEERRDFKANLRPIGLLINFPFDSSQFG